MPRQNYLTRESFVDATEKQIKESLLTIPAFASNIKLIAENKLTDSIRFNYELAPKKLEYHVNISVLPLNEKYTRISLHATYANGQAFQSNSDINIALHDFESAIHAAIKGEASTYKPYKPKDSFSKRCVHFMVAFGSSLGLYFLKKKLS
ncbi:MAG TPA: hypothetical protein VGC75_06260 [Candidatus Nitrosocosmicus sp.]|jgi:hypothetical protein